MSATLSIVGPFVAAGVVFCIACAGAIYKYGKIKNTVDDLKGYVFPKDKPKLVSVIACNLTTTAITEKLDSVGTKIDKMEERREQARGDIQTELSNISNFIGRVDQYMTDHKGE